MKPEDAQGPKYHVDVEGTIHPWDSQSITTEEIAHLGGWKVSQGVIQIDLTTNEERTLAPGETVQLKPGMGFSKKISWRRGRVPDRVQEEVELIREHYPDLEFISAGLWIRIPNFPFPSGWSASQSDVAFQVPSACPGTPPYGIYVPSGLRYQGATPNNYTEPAKNRPPFAGEWGVLSWQPKAGWMPAATARSGSNLLDYVRSFAKRFREGR